MTTLAAQSSQNLPRHSPHSLSAAIPLPFAPTLGGLTTNSPLQQSRPASRLTTPLAATPPPPLRLSASEESAKHHRKVKYAGVEHTLGPTFSDEEDGDDSTFIASKMAALGLDPNGLPYHSTGFTAAVSHIIFVSPIFRLHALAKSASVSSPVCSGSGSGPGSTTGTSPTSRSTTATTASTAHPHRSTAR